MNTMQRRFINITSMLIEKDTRVSVMFGGAGVTGAINFEKIMSKYPERIFDAGILEQSIIGIAAGMSIAGFIPIFFAQAPFIVERAYEQLKIDFGYQNLGGNFVSIGGSAEWTFFGPTHHCPSDIAILQYIPNMEIVVPGTDDEFEKLYLDTYANNKPTYYRLSRDTNAISNPVEFGKATVIKKGKKATFVVLGPMLELAMHILGDEDVTILYYTTVVPFDSITLKENLTNNRVLVFEPCYYGSMTNLISKALVGECFKIDSIGIPLIFLDKYGTTIDNLKNLNYDEESVRKKYQKIIE